MAHTGGFYKQTKKNINMKQLLSLFLFLLPCLALAQYPSNGNQKITLGEQTTADGLIYRGVAADTTLTAKSDTAAYFVLDTVNINLYTYKVSASGKKWIQLGSDTTSLNLVSRFAAKLNISDTASMLTPYWRSGRFSGTLPVGNGGTGSATQNFVDLTNTQSSIGGKKTFTSGIATTANINGDPEGFTLTNTSNGSSAESTLYVRNESNNNASIFFSTSGTNLSPIGGFLADQGTIGTGTTISNGMALMVRAAANMRFYTSDYNNERMRIESGGEVKIGYGATYNGAYRLQVKDSVYVGGNVSASAYTTRSDYNLKDDIFDLKYGLNDILQLQPVEYIYKSNGSKQLGFIAQDIGTILPEVVSFEESMSVNYQAIIPILTKAIQEQQALIKALEQRIINLENK
jgi:hypothetical protein